MFTAFMGDASNIMSFYGDVNVKGGVGYAVEWWIFKPQKSGKQVATSFPPIYFKMSYIFVVFYGCSQDG